MSDDIEQKRNYLRSLYPYKKWTDRVDRMGENQVIAVYLAKKEQETKSKRREADRKRKREAPQDETLF